MKFTVITKKYGTQVIDTTTFVASMASTGSTVFRAIEHLFNEWFDHHTQPGAPMAKDIVGMYYGEADQPAIYSKKGAIRQGIEVLLEEVAERKLKVVTSRDLKAMDIECAFE